MRVVLLQDVKNVGKRFEVKEVSDGYARNFLIPKKLAKPADREGLLEKSLHDRKESEFIRQIELTAKHLKKNPLIFNVKSGPHGEVFGSVSAEDIKKEIQKIVGDAVKIKIKLQRPIKKIGEHTVAIRLPRGIEVKAKVILKLE